MKKVLVTTVFASAAFLFLGALPALARGNNYYYDGGARRTIVPVEDMVAEFGAGKSAVKKALPNATPLKSAPGNHVNIYKVSAGLLKPALDKGVSGSSKVSPVFREGNSPAGRLMALPGGALVNFKEGWTDGQVREWAASKGYSAGRKLNLKGNWFFIQTPAGQASLDAANAIQESGEVISASPNWWMDTAAK